MSFQFGFSQRLCMNTGLCRKNERYIHAKPGSHAARYFRMLRSVEIDGNVYRLDERGPVDISIPLRFNGRQPNAYGVEPATSKACEAGELVGDTRRGGSCNFEQYTLIPHCNGTHTECVGHITHERISVRDCLADTLVPSLLLTIGPEPLGDSNEAYPTGTESDLVLTRRALEPKLRKNIGGDVSALIVRTIPNDERKLARKYIDEVPPYFTTVAMNYIVES